MSRIDRRLMVAMSALFLAVAAVGPARAASPLTEPPTGTPKVATVEKRHPRPEVGRTATDQHGPKGKNLPCVEKVHEVQDQGPSCRVANGLFKVRLSDGSVTYTHGPDALLDDDHDHEHEHGSDHHDDGERPGRNGQTGDLGAITARNPVCTSANPHGAYGFHAVIAIPADGSQTITAAAFRSLLQQVDGSIYKSAVESGSPNGADLVFDCDSTGAIAVDVVRLATGTANDSFSSIVGDLKKLG